VTTLSRGEVVCVDGAIRAEPGRGRFLPRGPYDHIRPLNRFVTPFNPVDRVLVGG
jgi:dihydropyrimidinase